MSVASGSTSAPSTSIRPQVRPDIPNVSQIQTDRGFTPTNIAQPAATAIDPIDQQMIVQGLDSGVPTTISTGFGQEPPVPLADFSTPTTDDPFTYSGSPAGTQTGDAAQLTGSMTRPEFSGDLTDIPADAFDFVDVDNTAIDNVIKEILDAQDQDREDRGFTPTTVAPPAATATTVVTPRDTTDRGFTPTTVAPPAATVTPIGTSARDRTDRGFTPTNVAEPKPVSSPSPRTSSIGERVKERSAIQRAKSAAGQVGLNQARQIAEAKSPSADIFSQINKGGLATKPKKKKATPKNRGIAARK